jgi:glycerophosphoryl diester phosphodiesterase
MPENSISGFIKALELGVSTLEMDVVISGDEKVIVVHDHHLNPAICHDELGNSLSLSEAKKVVFYRMAYDDISAFDCGSRGNPSYPHQQKVPTHIPLLSAVIDTCEQHVATLARPPVQYNIELKSTPRGDGTLHPAPDVFSQLVYKTLDGAVPWERVIIQSFDVRILEYWHKHYPQVRLAYLVERKKDVRKNMTRLTFQPYAYSPNHTLLSAGDVQYLQSRGIKVIPWTVNKYQDIKKMLAMKVDGLITDYPNRYFEIVHPE